MKQILRDEEKIEQQRMLAHILDPHQTQGSLTAGYQASGEQGASQAAWNLFVGAEALPHLSSRAELGHIALADQSYHHLNVVAFPKR